MEVRLHRTFLKQYERLPAKIKVRVKKRLGIFRLRPFDEILHNHALTGDWLGHRSINVTGDFRAIYKPEGDDAGTFVAIGTHSQLYF